MPKNNNVLYRDLRFEEVVDQDSRTVSISFSSEEPVKRYNWRREEWYDEILGHNAGNVNLSRLQNIGVALFNHDRNAVIGAIVNPELDESEHRCKAQIRFDKDEFAEKIYQKVLSGTLKGISVGYSIEEFEEVRAGEKSQDGRFEGPCVIATDWMPYEVSVVSIPADANVGVGRSMLTDEEMAAFRNYKKEREELEKQKEQDEANHKAFAARQNQILLHELED